MSAKPKPATALPDILPTHSCFDDALDFFDLLSDQGLAHLHHYSVVHAVCLGHALGTPYAHAWVEDATDPLGQVAIWQKGVMRATGKGVYWALERSHFYRLYSVQEVTRYSAAEAIENVARHGHYGPWRDDLHALCNDTPGGRVVGCMTGIGPIAILEVR